MDPFWSWVLLSFILGALIVAGVTVLGERLGTKIGGFIGSLPHLIIVSFYFIGMTQGIDAATEATILVPATMGINALFLYSYYMISTKNKWLAPVGAFTIWGLLAGLVLLVHIDSIKISILIFLICTIAVHVAFGKRPELRERRKKSMRYTPIIIVGRGALAGSVIALGIIISKYSGPLIGGMFSVFPAMMLSTMLIYTYQHDERYAGSMAKTMIIGVITVVTYAIACQFVFPLHGLAWGSLAGFIVALGTVVAIYPIVRSMR